MNLRRGRFREKFFSHRVVGTGTGSPGDGHSTKADTAQEGLHKALRHRV